MREHGNSFSRARNELAYGSRHLWVLTKDALGLPRTGSDRSFYIAQLVRKLRNGELGRNVRVTAAGKSDGAGAQGLAQISAIAFAAAFDFEYLHSPLRTVCHVEGPKDQWAQSWEKNFNFGYGFSQIDSIDLPIYPLGDFLKDQSLWKKDCVVQLIHFQQWTNKHTWAYEAVAPRIRANYYRNKTISPHKKMVVAVHIRRGDVSATKFAKTHFTPSAPIAVTLDRILKILQARGEKPVVQIFSQGQLEDFSKFSMFGAEFHLNSPAIWTFNQLVKADVLIMARSAFSYVAALLSDGVKLYDPFQERQLQHWVVRDASGYFDEAFFNKQLALVRSRSDEENIKYFSPATTAPVDPPLA